MSRQTIGKYSWGYALTHLISGLFHRLYYRRLQVKYRDKIPENSPVIFALNHQNALMDALSIVYTMKGQVVFLARADIFKKKFTSAILYFLKILPAYRIRDGFHSVDQNKEVFKEVFRVMENGRPVALFPEGSHLGQRRLRPLKKGVARMALQSYEFLGATKDVYVVPIGLYYSNYYHAGSDLLAVCGDPISASDYMEQYLMNQPAALGLFTDELARGLNEVIINIDTEKHYQTIHDAIEIYCSDDLKQKHLKSSLWNIFSVKKELAGKICADISEKEKQITDLQTDLERYNKQLKDLKIRDRQIAQPFSNLAIFALKCCISFLLLPFHLYGMIMNYLPYGLPIYLARNVKDQHFISSIRFVYGLMFFFVWYLLLLISSFIIFKHPLIAVAVFLSIPLTGLFAFYHYKYIQKLRADFRWAWTKFRKRKLFTEITDQRKSIIRKIEELI